MYIPDNLDMFERYDAAREAELQKLPVCSICKEYIQQEHAVFYNGKWSCKECEEDFWQDIRSDFLESVGEW